MTLPPSSRPAVAGILGLLLVIPAAAAWRAPGPGAPPAHPSRGEVTGGSAVAGPPAPAVPVVPPSPAAATATTAASATVTAALRAADIEPVPTPTPVRLRIDAIEVDAPVGPVGVAEEGTLEVFDDVRNVGWYRHGPAPGEDGSAVLAAHVDHWRDGPGIFFRLRELSEGDPVAVVLDDGTVRWFRVSGVERHPRDELPTAELFRTTGEPVLTLVTCGGRFDEDRRAYEDNVVVRAVPAGSGEAA